MDRETEQILDEQIEAQATARLGNQCSFCERNKSEFRFIVTAKKTGVSICDGCVIIMVEQMFQQGAAHVAIDPREHLLDEAQCETLWSDRPSRHAY